MLIAAPAPRGARRRGGVLAQTGGLPAQHSLPVSAVPVRQVGACHKRSAIGIGAE